MRRTWSPRAARARPLIVWLAMAAVVAVVLGPRGASAEPPGAGGASAGRGTVDLREPIVDASGSDVGLVLYRFRDEQGLLHVTNDPKIVSHEIREGLERVPLFVVPEGRGV